MAVVGAGPWGLAIAWRAAQAGARVVIHDDGAPAAGWVAAGMLGPWSEAADGEADLGALMVDAAARWPHFARDLAEASGREPGYAPCGALVVASRPEHVAPVRRHRERLAALGTELELLTGSALRALEPGLSPRVSGGLHLPGEHQTDPRALIGALREATRAAGVTFRPRAEALPDDAERVVLAAGWASGRLARRVSVRPVKGQVLRLRTPDGAPPPLTHVVRAPSVYVVPRGDGEVVVGGTVEERGDRTVTAGAVHELLDEAIRIVPELGELALSAAEAGLRPATPDGRPAIGVDPEDGVVWATGGFRHGILLTPVVADALAGVLAGRALPERLAPFAPDRFPAPVEAACA